MQRAPCREVEWRPYGRSSHLDRHRVFLLFVVDVAHVYPEPAGLGVLLVLDDQRVRAQRLRVLLVRMVLVGQVEADCVGQVDIDLVDETGRLPLLAQHTLLLCRLLRLDQRSLDALLSGGGGEGRLFDQRVHLSFHVLQLLLRAALALLLQRRRRPPSRGLPERVELLAAGGRRAAEACGQGQRSKPLAAVVLAKEAEKEAANHRHRHLHRHQHLHRPPPPPHRHQHRHRHQHQHQPPQPPARAHRRP